MKTQHRHSDFKLHNFVFYFWKYMHCSNKYTQLYIPTISCISLFCPQACLDSYQTLNYRSDENETDSSMQSLQRGAVVPVFLTFDPLKWSNVCFTLLQQWTLEDKRNFSFEGFFMAWSGKSVQHFTRKTLKQFDRSKK